MDKYMEKLGQKDQAHLKKVRERSAQKDIIKDEIQFHHNVKTLLLKAKDTEEKNGCDASLAQRFANNGTLRQKEGCWHLEITTTGEVVRFNDEVYKQVTHEGNESSEQVKIFYNGCPKVVIRHIGGGTQ